MTRAEAVRHAAVRLAAAGIEGSRREARRLLAAALGISPEALLATPDSPVEGDRFESFLARREAREPLAFITGEREFWGLPFSVSSATLVPRPDSETLIEAAIAAFPNRTVVRRMLDLGTGTGNLLLAALTEFLAAWGVGVDVSHQAAALAARNSRARGLEDRSCFMVAEWVSALVGSFDLVLSNPPYIETGAIGGLMPEVARYEPALALDGGPDGLAAYRRIIPELGRLLTPGGVAVLELGATQSAAVAALAGQFGLRSATRPDLGGVDRALILCRADP